MTLFISHNQGEEISMTIDSPNSPELRKPRPMNSWLIFRAEKVKEMREQDPDSRITQAALSKVVSDLWKNVTPEVKRSYEKMAEKRKIEHDLKNPSYRYLPRVKSSGALAKAARKADKGRKLSLTPSSPTPKATQRVRALSDGALSFAGMSSFTSSYDNQVQYSRAIPPEAIPLPLPPQPQFYQPQAQYYQQHENQPPTQLQYSMTLPSRSQYEIDQTWSMLATKLDVPHYGSMSPSSIQSSPYTSSSSRPSPYFSPQLWGHYSRKSTTEEEAFNFGDDQAEARRWSESSCSSSASNSMEYSLGYEAGWVVDQSPVYAPSMGYSSSGGSSNQYEDNRNSFSMY